MCSHVLAWLQQLLQKRGQPWNFNNTCNSLSWKWLYMALTQCPYRIGTVFKNVSQHLLYKIWTLILDWQWQGRVFWYLFDSARNHCVLGTHCHLSSLIPDQFIYTYKFCYFAYWWLCLLLRVKLICGTVWLKAKYINKKKSLLKIFFIDYYFP